MSHASPSSRPPAELFRALALLAEPPGASHGAAAAALGLPAVPGAEEHTEVFVLQCHPYASVHLGPEGMLGGEARDRVAGFWRALGLVPPAEPDHLGALLALYAALCDARDGQVDPARRASLDRAGQALLWEHLLPWAPVFLLKVAEAGSAFHRAWADLALDALLVVGESVFRPAPLPLALRDAGPPLDPAEGGPALLTALLAPIRSGAILTRADLARGAREAGLGLRIGERRFVLGAMLEQDAAATLRWLSGEVSRWAERHRSLAAVLEAVPGFWERRARSTAAILAAAAPKADRDPAFVDPAFVAVPGSGVGTRPDAAGFRGWGA